jgi:hypothetical protein
MKGWQRMMNGTFSSTGIFYFQKFKWPFNGCGFLEGTSTFLTA